MLPFVIKSNSKAPGGCEGSLAPDRNETQGLLPHQASSVWVVFRDGPGQGATLGSLGCKSLPFWVSLRCPEASGSSLVGDDGALANRSEQAGQPGSEHEPPFLALRATAQGRQGFGSPCPGLPVSVKYLEVSGNGDGRLPLAGESVSGIHLLSVLSPLGKGGYRWSHRRAVVPRGGGLPDTLHECRSSRNGFCLTKCVTWPGAVAHACNPGTLGGQGGQIMKSRD